MSTLRQQYRAQRERYLTRRQRVAHRAKSFVPVAVVDDRSESSWWDAVVRLIRKVIA